MNLLTTDYVRFPEMIAAPHYMQNAGHPSEVYMNISLFPFNTINKCLTTKQYTYCVVPEGYHALLVPERDYQILSKKIDSVEDQLSPVAEAPKKIESSAATKLKESQVEKPRRPPNPFFLFRKDKQASVFAQNRGISNLEVSKVIGKMWKTASFQEKEYYQKLAEEFKREHQEKYPDYKYSPVKQKRKCKKSECGFNKKHQRCPEYPVSGDPNLTCFTPTADGAHLNSGNRPSFLDVTLGEMPLNLALDTQELDITTDLDSPVFSEISLPNEATWPYHFPPYYEQSACSFDQFNLGLYVPEARFSQEFYDPLLIPHQYFQN